MATTILNQATVTFNYDSQAGEATSNIATATLLDVLTIDKNAIQGAYQRNQILTYSISIENTSAAAMTNVTAVDDLGTYTIPGPVSVTPLTYIGPAALYVNGVFSANITATTGAHNVTFAVGTIAVGDTVTIVYTVQVNEYALLAVGSTITNTATVNADGLAAPLTTAFTLPVADFAEIVITKDMSPDPVIDGETLTYTFLIYNYGNTIATDLILTDTFDPAPATPLVVRRDGVVVDPANYTYAAGTLTLPTGGVYTITVAAATYAQDPVTGIVTVTPGLTTITVAGTI